MFKHLFLPVIQIDTRGGAPIADRENYVNMTFTLTDPDNPANNVTAINNTYGIRGRGHSTWEGGYNWSGLNDAKKPYRIKFDRKQPLFGLPAARSWVLLAESPDPTLIKNMTAFELGNVLNLPYNHTYRHVRLYLNGDYRGVYGLTEHNQAGKGRVDIDRVYGWLVNMDGHYDSEPKFRASGYELPVMIKSPKPKPANIGNPAYNFVISDVNGLCDSVASPNFPESGYRDLIDVGTFVDFLLVHEFLLHQELFGPANVFMYRDKGGKIGIGPLWDFDLAFGFSNTFGDYTRRSPFMHNFFRRFFEDPVFLVRYKERWNGKYSEIRAVSDFIGRVGGELERDAEENFKVWDGWRDAATGDCVSYARLIEEMREWWDNRCTWLDGEVNRVEVLPSSVVIASGVLGADAGVYSRAFTLVSYGDMSGLSASLQGSGSSDFEIVGGFGKSAAGGGGYLASVSVRPKNSLPAGTYADTLILSGVNRGAPFSFDVPLIFVVDGERSVSVLDMGGAAAPSIILTVEDTLPNQSGIVNFYREGGRIAACKLGIYNAVSGAIINEVEITDDAATAQTKRKAGAWDLTDKQGRRVPAGTYLVNGVIKTLEEKREEVSVIVGVR